VEHARVLAGGPQVHPQARQGPVVRCGRGGRAECRGL